FTNDGATDNCSVPLSFKYTTEAQPFVTGQNLSPSQWNNYTGWKGMKLTVGASPVTVTELGRWVLSGNSGTHTVKLVNSSGAAVGSVSVATSGAPAGQFKYVALGSPVTLSASQVYYLVSQETSGGDYWWGYTTTLSHTSVATVNNAVTSSDGASFTNDGATDNCSVPLSFKYN
ncbi:MAG TPA: hypothetical protein PLP42_01725, partial [Acidobacteriota bacterium]|nr:hypothetical protein [Acidobacteriota bacterium]